VRSGVGSPRGVDGARSTRRLEGQPTSVRCADYVGLPSWSFSADALFGPIPVGHHARPLLGSEPSAQKSVQSP
jgi:hypothetical protein